MTRSWRLLITAGLCLALTGCALLGKSDSRVHRYFTPEYEGSTVSPPAKSTLRLRLGQVAAWSHLRERMVVRNEGQEVLFSEGLRWTEPPEVYLRRALSRALFEEQGIVQVMSGRGVTLEAELLAFEELAKKQSVRLQVLIVLHDERTGLLEETITVELPVRVTEEAEHPLAVVEALSQALHAGVSRVAERVVAKLSTLSPPEQARGSAR